MFKIDSKTRIHSDFIFLSLPKAFSYPPTLCSLSTVRTFIKSKLTLIVPWFCCKPQSSFPIQLGLRVQVMELICPCDLPAPPLSTVCHTGLLRIPSLHCSCSFCSETFFPVASLDLLLFFLKSTAQCLSVYLCLPIINE